MKTETLIAYLLNELPADQKIDVGQAIARDPDAARRLRAMQSIVRSLQAHDSAVPSSEAVARAINLFDRSRDSVLARILDAVDQVVASLIFDSRAMPAKAGFRGGGSAIRLEYAHEDLEIFLELSGYECPGEDPQFKLMGQIAGPTMCQGWPVAVMRSGERSAIATALTDEAGVFSVSLPTGPVDVVIRHDDTAITLQNISLE